MRWPRSRTSASAARRRPPAARVGGTDSTSFNNAGLPGIGFAQDSIEYNTHTHHTNLDTYERVIEDDVKASAVTVATAALPARDARRDAAALPDDRDARASAGADGRQVAFVGVGVGRCGGAWLWRVERPRLGTQLPRAWRSLKAAPYSGESPRMTDRNVSPSSAALRSPDAVDLAQRFWRGGLEPGHVAQRRVVEDDVGRHAAGCARFRGAGPEGARTGRDRRPATTPSSTRARGVDRPFTGLRCRASARSGAPWHPSATRRRDRSTPERGTRHPPA